jgi:uncharacterized protein (TIGR00255 family)
MSIHSMTGFAQVRGQVNDQVGCTLSLKAVNHRFLDLQLRLPPDSDALEMKLRRELRQRLHRGHVELTISLDRTENTALNLNRTLVGGYIKAFRAAAAEFGISSDPDLNAILRMPGAMDGNAFDVAEELEPVALRLLDTAVTKLNIMRSEEGRGMEAELRQQMVLLRAAAAEVENYRSAVFQTYLEKVQSRMQELLGSHTDRDRILQEAALLAERSDIQEEVVRMQAHVVHFLGMLDQGGEAGKKLDFLLQEMVREANTLLSKTSGVAGDAQRITELGLAMKAGIEKAREQVQNIE